MKKTLDDYLYTYFASGANSPGDMLGLIDCSLDWGCSVSELTPHWELGVQYTLDTDVLTFWDSGAFSEMDLSGSSPRVKYPITDKDWVSRLRIYRWVAEALGPQAFLVAPDQVAVQLETLRRLQKYAGYMQRCRSFGAEIIVPHQGGELSLEDFTDVAAELLDFDDFVVGFPMKKGVTSLVTVADYCGCMQPSKVHLLGIGPRRKGQPKLIDCLEAIERVSPETEVFCDSVLLRGMRERTVKIRPLTRAADEAIALIRERLHGVPPEEIPIAKVIKHPEQYLGHVRWRLLRERWDEEGTPSKAQCIKELEREWALVLKTSSSVIWRHRESIRRVLCPGAYDPGVTEAEAEAALEGPPRPKRRRR
jgi:hypothetical protein